MIVLVTILLAAAALAWWGARRGRTEAEFFVAGRRAGGWLVGIAGTAAAVSAFTFVGGPALFAAAGAGSLWIVLSAPLTGALQCWAVGEPIVALARRHGVLTVPELLGTRFGSAAVRGAAAIVVLVGCIATLAVQARAAAVLGERLLSVPGPAAALVTMLATAAYATSGGMRVSLPTEAAQGSLMAAAAVLLAVAAVAAAGGPMAILSTLERARPELLGPFGTVPPARAWAWWMLFCLGTCAQPHYLQKFLFLRDAAALRQLPAVLTLALAATLTVWLGLGLAGAALVVDGRLSLAKPDDLTPQLMLLVGPWAVVVTGVAVLAALMSTAASLLNLAAAAVTRDLPAALGFLPLRLAWARGVTAGSALAATAVALISERAVALLGIAGWGFFTAALLPALLVALAWPSATPPAVVAAVATGGAVDLGLEAIRATLPPGLEPGLAGAAVGVLVLVGVSFLTRRQTPGKGQEPWEMSWTFTG